MSITRLIRRKNYRSNLRGWGCFFVFGTKATEMLMSVLRNESHLCVETISLLDIKKFR